MIDPNLKKSKSKNQQTFTNQVRNGRFRNYRVSNDRLDMIGSKMIAG